jgi:hypothetical protein
MSIRIWWRSNTWSNLFILVKLQQYTLIFVCLALGVYTMNKVSPLSFAVIPTLISQLFLVFNQWVSSGIFFHNLDLHIIFPPCYPIDLTLLLLKSCVYLPTNNQPPPYYLPILIFSLSKLWPFRQKPLFLLG